MALWDAVLSHQVCLWVPVEKRPSVSVPLWSSRSSMSISSWTSWTTSWPSINKSPGCQVGLDYGACRGPSPLKGLYQPATINCSLSLFSFTLFLSLLIKKDRNLFSFSRQISPHRLISRLLLRVDILKIWRSLQEWSHSNVICKSTSARHRNLVCELYGPTSSKSVE